MTVQGPTMPTPGADQAPGQPAPTQPSAPALAPAPQDTQPAQERTFTQADVDRIIQSRIAPLQAKATEYDKLSSLRARSRDAARRGPVARRNVLPARA